jgi:dienelactone hydrolase
MRKRCSARLPVVAAACTVVAALSAGCAAVSADTTTTTATAARGPGRLALPAPSGRYRVGTVSLHLIDRSRPNPFAAAPPYRELMVSIWYPAASPRHRYPLAPYMLGGAAAHFGAPGGQAQQLLSVPPGSVDWAGIRTSGHQNAPVAHRGHPFPVVLYSPDLLDPRALGTTEVQDLASRGYVVVTIDDTYETSEVEFPGGRLVASVLPSVFNQPLPAILAWAKKDVAVRAADARFVLDELTALNGGRNPDAERRAVPRGLAGALDLGRVGMFGESLGGMTAAQAMDEDHRIKAGLDLDGNDVGTGPLNNTGDIVPALNHGLSQPFMIMANPGSDINTVPAWWPFWQRSTGWHLDLTLEGAGGDHAYGDAAPLLPQIARLLGLPDSFVTSAIGTIDPAKTVPAEEAYISAFFGRWLRGVDNHLLDGPSPRYPEFIFVQQSSAH